MTGKVYLAIIIRIVLLCIVGMVFTYIPEHLRGFFGDTPVSKDWRTYEFGGIIDSDWHWGARHYWYHWMCVALFIVSVVKAIVQISETLNSEDNDGSTIK